MALCPAGHQSQTTDYCDTCGAVMGGAPITPASAGSAASSPASVSGSGSGPGSAHSGTEVSSSGSTAGGPCPQCGAARGGRFCEECGFDFELAELVPPGPQPASQASAATPDPLAETATMPPDYDFDAEFAKAEREFAASSGTPEASAPGPDLAAAPDANANGATAAPATNTPTPMSAPSNVTATNSAATDPAAAQTPASPDAPQSSTTPRQLAVVVIADPEYYSAQVERGDIVEDEFPFPKYPGERRFVLDGDRIRIGRASASRGIAVEIDLTGPPLDPAVSHLHAQLLRGSDGSWSVVDLNSANGTRLNGAAEPLAAESEVPVKIGDRIHLGVWTTLTLEET